MSSAAQPRRIATTAHLAPGFGHTVVGAAPESRRGAILVIRWFLIQVGENLLDDLRILRASSAGSRRCRPA